MLTVRGYENVPAAARGGVLAIGNFDGVHRGHRELLRVAIDKGKAMGAPSGVMVFEPHPRAFFVPDEPHFRLTQLPMKLRLLEETGISFTIVVDFNATFANLSAEEFIDRVLVSALGVTHVVIGYDFFFGAKRRGTPDLMREAGQRLGFGVSIVAPVAEAGEVFSSSAARLHLAQGDVAGAAAILGRRWRVAGKVVGGAKRGTGLGYPTANIPLPRGTAIAHGIYAVHTWVDGEAHDGAAYLGTRPTFDNGMPVLEVFLFDFKSDLYGHDIEVEFVGFVRDDRKFDSAEALIRQMHEDVAKARKILAG
jgi:riboflavin kinase/FMN adenylyltransferase